MLSENNGLSSRFGALRQSSRFPALLARSLRPAILLALGLLPATGQAQSTSQATNPKAFAKPSAPAPIPVFTPSPIVTYHGDNLRTGSYTNEPYLAPTGAVTVNSVPATGAPNRNTPVNKLTFGRLFTRTLDGTVFAQPLYVPNVAITGKGTHNVLFVATNNNSIYALDADSSTGPLWQTNYNYSYYGIGPIPSADVFDQTFGSQIGILGTPVINPASQTLYVVIASREGTNHFQRLHALDIRTGKDIVAPLSLSDNTLTLSGSPLGDYNALEQNSQSALLLDNRNANILYVSSGTYGGSENPLSASGRLIAVNTNYVDPATRQRTMRVISPGFTTTQNGGGGITSSGAGPSQDPQGNLYVVTSQGSTDTGTLGDTGISAGVDASTSVIRINPVNPLNFTGLDPVDFFTPYNVDDLNASGHTIGTGGVLVLPTSVTGGRRLLVAAGYEGTVYVLDGDNLGGFNPEGDLEPVTPLPDSVGGVFGLPAFFVTGPGTGNLYYQGAGDVLQAFSVTDGTVSPLPFAQGRQTFAVTSATPAVSSNGTTNGVLWTVENFLPNGLSFNGAASPRTVVHAYDARTLTELWSNISATLGAGARDEVGGATRFSTPIVANGKVYVTGDRQLSVFGLSHNFFSANPVSQNQADYYTSSGGGGAYGTVSLGQPVSISVTPSAPDGNAIPVSGPVRVSSNGTTLGVLNFPALAPGVAPTTANTTQILTFTPRTAGFYGFTLTDAQGRISQASNFVFVQSPIDIEPGDATKNNDWDHFNISMPTTVRVGRTTSMTITAVTSLNTPTFLYDYDPISTSPTFRKILIQIPLAIQTTVPGSTFGASYSLGTSTTLRPLTFGRLTNPAILPPPTDATYVAAFNAQYIRESQITIPVRFNEVGPHVVTVGTHVDKAINTTPPSYPRHTGTGSIVINVVP